MGDLLEQGSMFLEDQRHRHMTRTVTYLRGAESVDLQATIGRTVFEEADDFGVVHRTETRDYLIRTQDLVLGGQPALPTAGDRIRDMDAGGGGGGGAILLYEVMAPGGAGGGEPPYRFSDPHRRTLRVHTKFIGTEAGP